MVVATRPRLCNHCRQRPICGKRTILGNYACVECAREARRKYAQEHAEDERRRRKAWQDENAARSKATRRAYYLAHHEEILEKQRKRDRRARARPQRLAIMIAEWEAQGRIGAKPGTPEWLVQDEADERAEILEADLAWRHRPRPFHDRPAWELLSKAACVITTRTIAYERPALKDEAKPVNGMNGFAGRRAG